jgi:SAM-dependent methyltransferase
MREKIIGSLRCPLCGKNLGVSYVPELKSAREGDDILFGIAGCGCRKYPVVYGILVFKELKCSKEAIEKIINSKTDLSLEKTVVLFMEEQFIGLVLHLEMIFKRFFGRPFRMTLWKLATFIKNSPFATYAKYRFSCPSLISAMPLFPVIKKALSNGGEILDLGCGMGHLTYLISRHFGAKNIYCADISFRGLYFARRFLPGKDSNFILLDANMAFPFADKTFQAVISMDALPFIENKAACVNEIDRVLKQDGLVAFVHLHNKLVPFIANGLPLTPQGYKDLFPKNYKIRSYSEAELMNMIFHGEDLDLGKDTNIEAVNRSDAISMVAVHGQDYLTKYPGYFDFSGISLRTDGSAYEGEKIILNPIYRKRKGKYALVFPAPRYEEEYYLIKDYFPGTVDPNTPEETLKRKMILIPAPENYMKKGEQLNYLRLWR